MNRSSQVEREQASNNPPLIDSPLMAECVISSLRRKASAQVVLPSPRNKQHDPKLGSDFGLFGNLQCIVNLYAKISNSRLQLGVSKQQLNGAQVLGPTVDQRGLGSSYRMGAIACALQS